MSIVTLVNGLRNDVQALTQSIVVENEVYQTRFSTCKVCEHYAETFHRCEECGCIVPFKAQLRSSTCPIGKW